MTETAPLPTSLCRRIVSRFGMAMSPPRTLETLQQLVTGYTRSVPWESASRILRRARCAERADCFLLGEAFWESHFETGGGGTCYESNYAFFGLLRRLGYEGYFTINDIGGAVGCHSAIVVLLGGCKYLVDVGFPVYAIVPINPAEATSAKCPIMNYRLLPQSEGRFQLRRESLARVHSFILHDKPVADTDYRAIGIHDYRPDGGQFLNEIVIQKIVDEQLWRFHSDVQPWCLQQFVNGERRDHALGADPAAELAAKFGIARAVLAGAIAVLGLEKT